MPFIDALFILGFGLPRREFALQQFGLLLRAFRCAKVPPLSGLNIPLGTCYIRAIWPDVIFYTLQHVKKL